MSLLHAVTSSYSPAYTAGKVVPLDVLYATHAVIWSNNACGSYAPAYTAGRVVPLDVLCDTQTTVANYQSICVQWN